MKSDRKGCSTCEPGKAQVEEFTLPNGQTAVQYDYRDADGELFSTVAPTLKEAQARCVRHLQAKAQRRAFHV